MTQCVFMYFEISLFQCLCSMRLCAIAVKGSMSTKEYGSLSLLNGGNLIAILSAKGLKLQDSRGSGPEWKSWSGPGWGSRVGYHVLIRVDH